LDDPGSRERSAVARWLRSASAGRAATSGKSPGQSLVELAFALPLLLLIMLGTIDLGRVFFDYIQLRNAVREGAAYAARNPNDSTGAKLRVTDHGVPSGTTVNNPVCTGNCTTIGGVGTMTVTATHTFTPVTTGFLQSYFGIAPFSMTVTASMRAMT